MGESPLSMYIEAPIDPAGPFPDRGLITRCVGVAGDHMIAREWGQVSIPD